MHAQTVRLKFSLTAVNGLQYCAIQINTLDITRLQMLLHTTYADYVAMNGRHYIANDGYSLHL